MRSARSECRDKRARLNCIAYLLSLVPYKRVHREKVKLPKCSTNGEYDDQATLQGRKFVPRKVLNPLSAGLLSPCFLKPPKSSYAASSSSPSALRAAHELGR
jgi:hypothetical protein